ncbi:hypothetical protein COW36_18545 [bacterium (Candidatus Blackallbacteria) CG17_big_fil_post_rev_8_21_14_2_50_48_46]|uniref:Immunity MXAN-0049 protein domain-containing protein n=1 Tax=bacterium (Candidatus Blackallbacteria) CG17_big_fil_post_rev_8_21_14_2_50_48_46 TaxID=2014261 RepID=A0A2M7G131_9BACT|nr:MAG: hypothetical protein COW64_00190 [bacterium (Candidatus Blackallbacteria) CG18_big_fil_WC_8_21_14_2_50_49_26]PIW15414.1 MAG: hypothetical protein COW36_18545 [bacterium (Candidatus Blackallbacteria) CG17_big_fil_post_rev_8_21_14_2_50_48_46]PIW49725.1 MAG: hypothetical protein COW20_04820 [bacterium (Candidatus Blackallbacteria) CG13_big_fil_rev_8_21_14_2_50_49_14]
MSHLTKVYWLSQPPRRAGFQRLKRDSWLEDWNYIEAVSVHRLDHEQEIRILPYFLHSGKFSDFAFGGVGLLWFNQHVVDVFGDELLEYGRLYPIDVQDAPSQYYFYHVTKLVKAMDLEAVSKLDSRYQPGQPYNSISSSKFEFISENIQDLLVFKDIQQDPGHRIIFLGQRFVDILKKHKFTGVHKDTFKPIWPRPEPAQIQTGPRIDLADLNL